jgi:hypothetical protein
MTKIINFRRLEDVHITGISALRVLPKLNINTGVLIKVK